MKKDKTIWLRFRFHGKTAAHNEQTFSKLNEIKLELEKEFEVELNYVDTIKYLINAYKMKTKKEN